jgi:protein phosphatase
MPGTISAHAELPVLAWALRSHPGVVRSDNEDFAGAYAPASFEERRPLWVLADGMGGHAAGEVASRLAVESMLTTWTTGSTANPNQALRSAARSANAAVFAASLDQEHRGMGTTLTSLALAGTEAFVAHIGDSRAYLVHRGQCSQLTQDHSRVSELLRMRLITPEQAVHHPARSQLTRSLGSGPAVQVDLVRSQVAVGDTFVLCSDGVWDLVSRTEIAEAVAAPPEDAAETLVAMTLARGAPDNVTVIVVQVLSELPVSSAVRLRPSFFRRMVDRI